MQTAEFRQCHSRLPAGGWQRKVPYLSRRAARAVASKYPGYEVYRCARCGAYHVGKDRLGRSAGTPSHNGSSFDAGAQETWVSETVRSR